MKSRISSYAFFALFTVVLVGCYDKEALIKEALENKVRSKCSAEQFESRLNSKLTYSYQKKDGQFEQVTSDFLCLRKEDAYSAEDDSYKRDQGIFIGECDGIPTSIQVTEAGTKRQLTKEDLVKHLVEFFKSAEPYMQNFLCSDQLKRLWVGGEGASSYSTAGLDESSQKIYAMGLKYGVITYSTDKEVGLDGVLTWYEQKKTKKPKDVPGSYEDGTQIRTKLRATAIGATEGSSNNLTDTQALLMNYLYHEYGHFAINYVSDAPASVEFVEARDEKGNLIYVDFTKWYNLHWPKFFFDKETETKRDQRGTVYVAESDIGVKNELTEKAREAVCFFGELYGKGCVDKRIYHNDEKYGETIMPQFVSPTATSVTGFITNLSAVTPTETFAEWLAILGMARYYDSISVYLPPFRKDGQGNSIFRESPYQYEMIRQMTLFNNGENKTFRDAANYMRRAVEHMDSTLTFDSLTTLEIQQ